uniref:Uncharacterized protein n=1 Tax=Dictyoglomus turgidum TaxID=513050 RepID=A0A7C3SRC6_9BACT
MGLRKEKIMVVITKETLPLHKLEGKKFLVKEVLEDDLEGEEVTLISGISAIEGFLPPGVKKVFVGDFFSSSTLEFVVMVFYSAGTEISPKEAINQLVPGKKPLAAFEVKYFKFKAV